MGVAAMDRRLGHLGGDAVMGPVIPTSGLLGQARNTQHQGRAKPDQNGTEAEGAHC
jgi:hypothetical protein